MEPITSEPLRGNIGDLAWTRLAGIEAARMFVRGDLPRPPIHHLVGLTPTQTGLGTMTFTMPITRWLRDNTGIMWAGIFPLLADAPISMSLYTGLPPGKALTTSELSINFLRPPSLSSEHLVGRGRSVYLGREVGVAEATIENAAGRTMAHATTRCVVIDIPIVEDAPLPDPVEPITDPPDPYLRPVPEGLSVDPSIWQGDRLDTQRRYVAGEFPRGPINHLFDIDMVEVDEGGVELAMPANPWFSAGMPAMYGGVTALLCDFALTSAVWSTLPADAVAASLDLQVRYLRPILLDGRPVRVVGRVRHSGRRIRVAEAEVFDADGRRAAIAMGSSMVVPGGLEALKQGHTPLDIVRSAGRETDD
jgi:uncharacterized protein (TIGR00369 family)